MNYSQNLKNKITAYYERYYHSCGLKDFKERALSRLNEEEMESIRMARLQGLLNKRFERGQKHFIFGAGTGGLAVILKKEFGCDIFGIEPCDDEFDIIKEKLLQAGIASDGFKKEFGEKLSFADNQFDFVHCFTVLEHVQNVEKCISEMIRITKPGGYIYINTPNYRYPTERHYKIIFPIFLPKPFGYLYLLLRRKPPGFLKSLNYITENKLNKILNKQKDIYWIRIYKPLKKQKGLKGLFFSFFQIFGFVYPNQEIIIKKYA